MPVSQPASHYQGNDLVRELWTLESSPFSCLRPRILTGGLRQLGQGAWTMSVIPGISRWNMGNIRLGEEEAVEKGQEFFGGEQHSHRLHTSLCCLRVGGVTRVCTCLKTFSAIAKLIGQGGKTVVDLRFWGDTVQSMNSAQTVFREGILTQAQKLVGSEVLTKVHMLFLQIHSRQHPPPCLAEAAAGVEFFFPLQYPKPSLRAQSQHEGNRGSFILFYF